jgi:serine/threonine-protein kinase
MTVPAGEVIAERPTPGAPVHHGDVVQLVVSSGPPIVTIPDVHGLSTTSAERTLLGVHLHPDVASRSDDAPAHTVIGQEPDAGTQLRAGSNVVLIVSTGPDDDGDNGPAGANPANANPDNAGAPPGPPNPGASAAPGQTTNGPDDASPPPGWLRRQWWHLFHHRRHAPDPGAP